MLSSFFFLLSPIVSIIVSGNSMLPTYKNGQKFLVKKKWFFCSLKINDIIVFYHPQTKKLLVKRIAKKKNDTFFLVGDNVEESTDSRNFGFVHKKYIIGKVIS